jgi:hypothetical protein
MTMRIESRRAGPAGRALLAALAAALGVLAHEAATNWRRGLGTPEASGGRPAPRAVVEPAPATPEELRRRAGAAAAPLLDRADVECRKSLAEQLADLDQFFEEARHRAPRLAERLLGWEGRWALLADRLRLDPGAHAAFVRAAFAEVLFTPEQLEDRVRRAAEGYLEAAGDVEGELLVRLRQDLDGLPDVAKLDLPDVQDLRSLVERTSAGAAVGAGAGLRADAARELVALAVGEVLAQAAVRLGTSAGLLGAGAASAATTLGAGLVIGVVVDQLLAWLWDPRADLARALDGRLGELRRLVVDGTAEAPGLRRRLARFDRERAAARRAAVLEAINAGGGGP